MNKFLITILSTVCLFMFLFGFACNKPDKNNNGGNNAGIKRYTMEAEYINLDGISGGGHSSEASGVDMIYGDGTDDQKAKGWSNGYFVAFTHREGVEFEFIFNSAEAATGVTIVLRVGSEMGALTFSPSSFSINLNGDELEYGNMSIAHSPILGDMVFADKTVATTAKLVKGENVLKLKVLANDLAGGTTAGPIIDCVKITTAAKLTWTDKTENSDNRGGI